MKIKIGEEIYDSKQCPIMVILNAGEKKQISDKTSKTNALRKKLRF